MKPDEQGAYDIFMQTGRIGDYLNYIDLKQTAAGESIAYHDGRDCAAGTADRGI